MILWFTALLAVGLAWAGYWRYRIRPCWLTAAEAAGENAPGVEETIGVIVPARNEARTLPGLLADLAQEGPPGMEIVVADDRSIDGTSACVREAALTDHRVRLVICPHKPDSWSGKNWALAQGLTGVSAEWIVFCDADVRLAPGAIADAMRRVREESLDALALIPGMRQRGWGPSFLLACFAVSRALLFRPASPGRRGLVQGAFLVVRRAAYDSIGGHEGNRRALIEDVELGYRLHDAGFRVRAYPARETVFVQMYETLGETGNGLRRHLFAALSFSLWRLAGVTALHLFLFLFPFVSALILLARAFSGDATPPEWVVLVMSALSLSAMAAVAGRVVRAESLPWLSAVALPLSYFGMGAVLWASVMGYRRGGIPWKGRRYENRPDRVRLR